MEDFKLSEMKIFKKVNQIGIITTKFEEIVKNYETYLGIGPFNILDRKDQQAVYNGKEITFSTRTGIAWLGDLQIEINHAYEVPEGGLPHTDWIKRRGEGIHHLI